MRRLATHGTVLPRCRVSKAAAIGRFGGPQGHPPQPSAAGAPTAATLSQGRPCCQPPPAATPSPSLASAPAGWAVRAHTPPPRTRIVGGCERQPSRASRQTRCSWLCNRSTLGEGGGGRGGTESDVTDVVQRRRRCHLGRRRCHPTAGRAAAFPGGAENFSCPPPLDLRL